MMMINWSWKAQKFLHIHSVRATCTNQYNTTLFGGSSSSVPEGDLNDDWVVDFGQYPLLRFRHEAVSKAQAQNHPIHLTYWNLHSHPSPSVGVRETTIVGGRDANDLWKFVIVKK